ncbi:SsgA family sporulation/cell division regulator [Streptacidiphilus rugosus]|uniref:SsgA family sporulation/cell division regulator n=1 Tax=Streptacidiphilus rugosus TaxID=405783 RepID=UPI00055F09D1|nr:SsgA family sporulation/cell division regulator [Streptacidiphilus rugosus]
MDARLTVGNSQPLGLPLRFGYDSRDPFALTLDLRAPTGTVTVWRLSRDLVWEGLQQPTGLGDVRVWPPAADQLDLQIMLRGREATALLAIPAQPVRRWLATRAFALVPQGAEADLIDWDTELNHFRHSRG